MKPTVGSASIIPVHRWLCHGLQHDVRAALERLLAAADIQHVAIMPDVHPSAAGSGTFCNGIAIATSHLLYPGAVGGDIGCGYAAVQLTIPTANIDPSTAVRLLELWRTTCPWNRHRAPARLEQIDETLDAGHLSEASLRSMATRDGAVQLGTLGRGNHFLELQIDDEDRLWLMVHSGSRAIGPAIRDFHLSRADSGPFLSLDANTSLGQAFLRDHEWARRYALNNRRRLLENASQAASDILGTAPLWDTCFDRDHNHVEREAGPNNQAWYIHRKGAAPAHVGERGMIPGSAATYTCHTEGLGNPQSLFSSSHGAGRQLSRSESRRRISSHELRRQLQGVWFDARQAASLRDEAPAAYKDLRKVMAAQKDLIRTTRRLHTLITYKG